ncbi:BtpA/SgcQ family protein, partial [Acinetobacter baumannii]
MAVIARAIKAETKLPTGVQLLAGANLEALGVAVAANLDFLRVEGFVYAHVGDEGLHQACAAELIRRRANLKADSIKIFAD